MPEWVNIIIRSVVAISFLFIATKIIGKRELAQMTFFEFVAGITLGEIAGFIATDHSGPIYHGFIALVIFTLFPIVMGKLALQFKWFRDFADGTATILVQHGKILEQNLKKERITPEELLEQLRLKNAFRLADVEFALMEASGGISVLLKSDGKSMSHIVISDGNIMDQELQTAGVTQEWLTQELKKRNLHLSDVYLAQVSPNGELYIDLYEDQG